MNTDIKCPDCHGIGSILAAFSMKSFPCQFCEGTGKVSDLKMEWREKGDIHRKNRVAKRITLRQFAIDHDMDVGILSKMEMGAIEPKFPTDHEAC